MQGHEEAALERRLLASPREPRDFHRARRHDALRGALRDHPHDARRDHHHGDGDGAAQSQTQILVQTPDRNNPGDRNSHKVPHNDLAPHTDTRDRRDTNRKADSQGTVHTRRIQPAAL